MSNSKNPKLRPDAASTAGSNKLNSASGNPHLKNHAKQTGRFASAVFDKKRWLIFGIIAMLSLGALGAVLKRLEETANSPEHKKSVGDGEQTLLSRLNPFSPNPVLTSTPQLAKEYVYAGSRLLAIEDANAHAAAPADLAIWRPSNGEWWVMGGQGSQQTAFTWGTSGDVPVPGDFDGDSKTDFSVFRPSSGYWYVVKSSDNTSFSYAFGMSGDRAAPADYDGDGRTDAAVFRPSDGTWYIRRSSDSNLTIQAFGLSTDLPAPADYDGDGRADIAVWRNSATSFYSLNSSNNSLLTQSFAHQSAAPVSADYDGDGRADHAVRNDANWIIHFSATNQTGTISWQQSSDIAVQNDYDGDGRVDIAVWRASNGNWYIRKSSNGQLRQEHWGLAGDIPVAAFYKR